MKTAIWIISLLGLAPIAYICVAGAGSLWSSESKAQERLVQQLSRMSRGDVQVHIHDSYSYLVVGPRRVAWHPRRWAIAAGAIGILLVLGSLLMLLHVPLSTE
jgi:hypothetical protein